MSKFELNLNHECNKLYEAFNVSPERADNLETKMAMLLKNGNTTVLEDLSELTRLANTIEELTLLCYSYGRAIEKYLAK